MTSIGERDQLITFQRATVVVDDYGGETPTWADYATAWAQVRRGTGQERREAAQESASRTATFVCDWNPTLAAVKVTDHIVHGTDVYDITDVAPQSHSEIQFTGTNAL